MSAGQIDDSLDAIRQAVRRQLGVDRVERLDFDVATLPRFGADLPAELPAERRRELSDRADELEPWLQGPFYLGGDLVIGGAWRNDLRWDWIGDSVPDLSGRRVLDVGSNAGYDPFMFHSRGAEHVLAVEPYDFIRQALFLEEVYRTGVEFQQIGWQQLDPEVHGRFDFVHCHGVLYHEPHPLALPQKLRSMIAEDGELLFGSIMLARPEVSEYARFVPDSYFGDETWWWVPGRLAMRWMLEAAGFADVEDLGVRPGVEGEFPVTTGYFRAVPGERLPHLEQASQGVPGVPPS
jgi:SAM-dependent methyltransferase